MRACGRHGVEAMAFVPGSLPQDDRWDCTRCGEWCWDDPDREWFEHDSGRLAGITVIAFVMAMVLLAAVMGAIT